MDELAEKKFADTLDRFSLREGLTKAEHDDFIQGIRFLYSFYRTETAALARMTSPEATKRMKDFYQERVDANLNGFMEVMNKLNGTK